MLIARYSPLPEPETNIKYSYVQDVYVSDIGCQLVIKVNLKENSCFPFGYCSPVSYNFSGFKMFDNRWSGRYCGPGSFCLAVPIAEQVVIITDHSAIYFLKDGTPCESVLLDKPITDAGKMGNQEKI